MRILVALVLFVGLFGCTAQPPPPITASLIDPTEIRLTWRPATGALGQVVEYRNQPTGQFITLAFLPPDATTYTHPRLIPKTQFYYRVRAFFGSFARPVATPAATGVLLTWTAPLEDATLVEIGTRVAAVLPPRTHQFTAHPLPNEQSAPYRIAAIRYGPPTPVVEQTTG